MHEQLVGQSCHGKPRNRQYCLDPCNTAWCLEPCNIVWCLEPCSTVWWPSHHHCDKLKSKCLLWISLAGGSWLVSHAPDACWPSPCFNWYDCWHSTCHRYLACDYQHYTFWPLLICMLTLFCMWSACLPQLLPDATCAALHANCAMLPCSPIF